jgi:hypothetical protein
MIKQSVVAGVKEKVSMYLIDSSFTVCHDHRFDLAKRIALIVSPNLCKTYGQYHKKYPGHNERDTLQLKANNEKVENTLY